MRLIDADALIERFERAQDKCDNLVEVTFFIGVMSMVDAAPTIDAERVRQGRWEGWHGDYMRRDGKMQHFHYYECSECCRRTAVKSNYCPNCGAKMMEVQDELRTDS